VVNQPLISVIIPTFERPGMLKEALESVLAQSFTDWECLVVDDASQQPPVLPADERLRLIQRSHNGGCAAARNTGLSAARGRYVAFLDDDDVYLPDRLADVAGALAANESVVLCQRIGFDGSRGGNRTLVGSVYDVILDGLTPHLGQIVVERAIAPEFDTGFPAVEDVDWWLRLAQRTPISTVESVGLRYRQHDDPRSGHGTKARIDGSLRLLEKHADYFVAHRRAHAFRWKRIALLRLKLGDRSGARGAFLRSLRIQPEYRTVGHIIRTYLA